MEANRMQLNWMELFVTANIYQISEILLCAIQFCFILSSADVLVWKQKELQLNWVQSLYFTEKRYQYLLPQTN